MSWYRVGTVTVTNGVTAVAGVGTSWFSVIAGGWAFRGPDGRVYEIQSVASDTSLTLAEPYLGPTLSGQAYAAYPTQGETRTLAQRLSDLIATYSSFVTTKLTGLFSAGSAATPGVASETDPNTGIYWPTADTLAIATGGVDRAQFNAAGRIGLGIAPSGSSLLKVGGDIECDTTARTIFSNNYGAVSSAAPLSFLSNSTFEWKTTSGAERMRIDAAGNVLVGTASNPAGNKLNILDPSSFGIGVYRGVDVVVNGAAGEAISMGALVGATQTTAAQIVSVLTDASSGTLNFNTRSGGALVERMRIDASGNVGVGTTSFGYATGGRTVLGINGPTSSLLELQTGGLNRGYLQATATGTEIGSNGGFVGVVTGGAERMRIDASGNWLLRNPPSTPPTLTTNGDLTLNPTSNTNVRISYRGGDGVTRVANITLA